MDEARLGATRTAGVAALAVIALLALPPAALGRPAPNAVAPVPGGVYNGQTGTGKQVEIRVSSSAPDGWLSGVLQVRCAGVPVRAHFRTDDGTFVANKRNRRGAVVFRASGRFAALDEAVGQITKVPGHGRCASSSYNTKLTSPAGVQSTTVRWGPFSVEPMGGGDETTNFLRGNVQRPCSNCYIIGMVPDLSNPGGQIVNMDTEAMLHHMVLFNTAGGDASCTGWPQRFFASGNERTTTVVPNGYGYYVGPNDSWALLAELMNMSAEVQDLSPQVTFYFVRAPAALTQVKPLWLDVNNCGSSRYSIPAGYSDTQWSYTVPASIAGRIVALGGHVHDDGVRIAATDVTSNRLLCNSIAGYGSNPAYMETIESMSGCVGDPLARINTGDVLRLNSIYDSPTARNDVMGIMVAYVDPDAVP